MPYATGSEVSIHYEVEGSGPPLVLHTAFMGSLADWYSNGYVDALKGESTLVLLDPRGHGDSDKPHETAMYSPAQRVADVLAVLDALGIAQADFLGYSMGGWVGYHLGAQAPECVRSLIIGGAAPFGAPPNRAWAELLRQGIETIVTTFERAMGPAPAEVRARMLTGDAEALAAATLTERPSLEAVLPSMRLPVLLYCGDQDPYYEQVQRAAALLPSATLVSLSGLNHMQAGLTDAATVLPHIAAFLRRVRASAGAAIAPS